MEKEPSRRIILQFVQDSWSILSRLDTSQKTTGGRSKCTLEKVKQNMDYGLRCMKPQRADAIGAHFICDL